MKKNKIIMLTYYDFPCQHPVLENVFAKEIGKKHEIIWLFQGDVSRGRMHKWHNSQVLLSKRIKADNFFSKSLNQIFKWHKIFNLLVILRKGGVGWVFVRDLPLEAILVSLFRDFFDFKLYFQYSAPQGHINIEYSKNIKGVKKGWFFLKGNLYNLLIKRALKSSHLIFPITDFHKQELSSYIQHKKMIPITMGVDIEWVNGNKNIIAELEKVKRDNFIITYFGTLNFGRNPLFVLEMFSLLKKECFNCKLLLIGKTANSLEKKWLEELCYDLDIKDDVIFTGFVSRNEVRSYLEYCDLSISAIPPDKHFKISSPTKLYESMGCGVPVVANKGISEQEKVILESGGGVIIDYEIALFSKAILSLLNNKELRDKMSIRGKEYIMEHYSYSEIAKQILPYF